MKRARPLGALARRGSGGEVRGLVVSCALLLCVLQAGCGTGDSVGRSQQAVISGADDRQEPYALDPTLLHPLTDSVAALMYAHRIVFTDSDRLPVRATSLGDTLGLCADEPFRDQPDAAQCSGVLIDDDLLATAGHCLGESADDAARICRELRIVFGFQLSSPSWDGTVAASDVFSCKSVVLQERVNGDYAVLQLDRSATNADRAPASLGARPAAGDTVDVSSTTAGLPLKVELGAAVLEASDSTPYFVAATDTFSGSSGGGVFAQDLGLVGLVDRGGVDWEDTGECTRSFQVAQSAEQHQYAAPIRTALCARPWPSQRLCDSAGSCGDQVCSAAESHDTCPSDCAPPRCGDGVCELDERASCLSDCHRYDDVPVSWGFEPEGYLMMSAVDDARAATASHAGCAVGGAGEPVGAAYWAALVLVVGWAIRRRAKTGWQTAS